MSLLFSFRTTKRDVSRSRATPAAGALAGRLPWPVRAVARGTWVTAMAGLVGLGGSMSARASVESYDTAVGIDAAGGLVPAARLTQAAVLTGANRVPFQFGSVSGNVTLECIVEGNPAAITGSGFLAVGTNTLSSLRYEQWQNTGQLGFTQGGVLDYLFNPGVASPPTPTHLAWAWEAATLTMRLYVNGALAGTRSGVTPSFAMPSGQGWLGGNATGGELMTGTIHRVTVYDDLIAPEVILRHADAFKGVVRPPVIAALSASPATIFSPAASTVAWQVFNADRVLLNGADVTGQSSLQVTPGVTTTYTLTATNLGGGATGRVTVIVNPAPVIRRFGVQPAYVGAGGTVTLSWAADYGTDFGLAPGVGDVTGVTANGEGSASVSVAQTTDYILTVGNAFGSVAATGSVLVVQPAGHVVISEFMAANVATVADEDGLYSDWIELHNPTAAAVNLAGYYLTDDRSNPTLWAFPATNLPPGGHLLVFASGKDRRVAGAPLHANFQLDRAGEYLALIGPGLAVLQAFDPYPAQEPGISRGLLGGDLSTARDLGVPTPGATNDGTPAPPGEVAFSRTAGTFVQPFELALVPPAPGLAIRYTLDGTMPGPTNGLVYGGPLLMTETRRVRAVALAGGRAGRPSGASYVRLALDLAGYTSSLPMLVIENFGAGVIPQKGWSGDGSGIRQVPRQEAVWATFDRAEASGASALTNAPEMMSTIGIRGRGAFSSQWRQKPYSVEALGEDGGERAVEPLGMPAHADWVLYFPDPDTNKDPTLLFNTFAYELSRNTGHYAVRFRWVEAFVNEDGGPLQLSDRRGVYVLLEKVSRGSSRLDFERLSEDGTQGSWLLNLNRMDPEPDTGWPAPNGSIRPSFFHTAGPNRVLQTPPDSQVVGDDEPQQSNGYLNFDNPNGYTINSRQRAAIEDWFRQFEDVLWNNALWRDPTNGYRRFLDPVDFADYFILNTLTRNGDGLLISMFPWKGDDGKLRMGPAWDYNWSPYFISGGPTGTLLHRPDRLWYRRLFADPDFAQLYIDRWWDHRRQGMGNADMDAILDRQAAEISPAKALYNGLPSETEWAARLLQMKTWLKDRANWIDGNYLRPPVFSQDGGLVPGGFQLSISGTNGTIYYTVDGSDPRAPGGPVSGAAVSYQAPVPIGSLTTVLARIRNGTNWSGLTKATFQPPLNLDGLALTEIHYNPPAFGAVAGTDLEFIELANLGAGTLPLGGLSFTAGVAFTFTNGTRLEPGARLVLAANATAFAERYPGVAVHGVFSGRLDNAGETLRLSWPSGATVLAVTYNDRAPWPLAADGHGYSIVPRTGAPANSDSGRHWRASSAAGGSPGAPDPEPGAGQTPVYISEISNRSEPPAVDWIEVMNPGTAPVNIGGWFLSDDGGLPRKYRVPDGTVLPPAGRRVFTEADFNAVPGSALSFSLDAAGDAAYLVAADAAGNLTGFSHGADFGAAPSGATFGRWVTSTGEEQWPLLSVATPGAVDAPPAIGPVVISEIHYHPAGADPEFIELRNLTGAPVSLFDAAEPTNTWRLSGLGYVFPPGIVLPAGGVLLLAGDAPDLFRARHGLSAAVPVLGPMPGALQDSGERLELQRPDRAGTNGWVFITVDAVRYNDRAPWPSSADGGGASLQRRQLGLYGDDPAHWSGAVPTPGGAYDPGTAAPVIVVSPSDLTVPATREAVFAVEAAGAGPLYYQWLLGQAPIGGATNATLSLTNVQAGQAGDYSVVVFNAGGSTRSGAARLTVLAPAQIFVQPRDVQVRIRPDLQSAPQTNVTFFVQAGSSSPLRYQWRFNGVPIPGATQPSLTVTNVQLSNEGRYSAAITDDVGTIFSAEALLQPWISPFIVQAPLTQVVPAGGPVSLSVEVGGNPAPFTYEWRRSSTPMVTNVSGGRIDFFTFTATNVPQTNQYRVIVRNAANTSPGVPSVFASVITVADADGDGLPDVWETANGLNPGSATDGGADLDGDGMSNRAEYQAGTDPRDPASYLRVDGIEGGGAVAVWFGAVSNRTYAVEWAAVPGGPWKTLAGVPARATNRVERVSDSSGDQRRFYRLVTPGGGR